MYEPRYHPTLQSIYKPLTEMQFGVSYSDDYIDCNAAEPPHMHEYVELFLAISNEVSFLVNDQIYNVNEWDAVVVRPNEIHMCIFPENNVYKYLCIWIDADLASELLRFTERTFFRPIFAFNEAQKADFRELVLSFIDAYQTGETELKTLSYLIRILLFLNDYKPNGKAEETLPQAMRTMLEDIQKNYAEIRNVHELSTRHFVSDSTITRWFRRYVHCSPREYLESVRLTNVTSMLQNGATVTEACLGCGFADCSHFIVLFKKKFGETPFKYKQRYAK